MLLRKATVEESFHFSHFNGQKEDCSAAINVKSSPTSQDPKNVSQFVKAAEGNYLCHFSIIIAAKPLPGLMIKNTDLFLSQAFSLPLLINFNFLNSIPLTFFFALYAFCYTEDKAGAEPDHPPWLTWLWPYYRKWGWGVLGHCRLTPQLIAQYVN